MFTPNGTDYVWLILVVALLGAVGGVGAELMQNRGNVSGAIQLPRPGATGSSLVDLGVVATAILGAIAAVAVLYVLPPTTTTISSSGAATTNYEIVKGVALSVLAGSAGRGLLTSLQSRLQASASQQQAEAAVRVARTQAEGLASEAATAARTAVQEQVAARVPDLHRAMAETERSGQPVSATAPQVSAVVDSIVDGAAQRVAESTQAKADVAKQTIADAAPMAAA
jgi:hypothetical protein